MLLKSHAGAGLLDPATTEYDENVALMELPPVEKKSAAPKSLDQSTTEKGDPGERRLSLILSSSVYDDLFSLAKQRRSTMTEIVRLALGLIKVAIHETQQGNKIVVAKPNGDVLKEFVLPG